MELTAFIVGITVLGWVAFFRATKRHSFYYWSTLHGMREVSMSSSPAAFKTCVAFHCAGCLISTLIALVFLSTEGGGPVQELIPAWLSTLGALLVFLSQGTLVIGEITAITRPKM